MIRIGCLLLLGLPILGAAEDESEALSGFRRDWRNAVASDAIDEIPKLVSRLAVYDSADSAEALLELFDQLEKLALAIETERRANLLSGKVASVYELRQRLDPIRTGQERVLAHVAKLRSTVSWEWLVDEVSRNAKAPLQLRILVVQKAVMLPELQASLEKSFLRTRDEGELVIFLEAFRHGESRWSDRVQEKVVDLIDHKDPSVREQSAVLAARMALPAAVEPLVNRLEEEEGQTQLRIAGALEVLTRQSLGTSVDAWKRWFADQGHLASTGALPLGGGQSGAKVDSRYGTYHGIPQEGRSIIYVIDCSGSMAEAVDHVGRRGRGGQGRAMGEPAKPGETSRIEACQRELKKALSQLDPETRFNIVQYANGAEVYSPKMLTASPKQIERAQRWIDSLQADGATNIYDALELAFTIAGRGTFDRYYETNVDTIFLLTDGKPMLPGNGGRGAWDSTDRILQGAKRWNPHGRVVIHTVGIGQGVNARFLGRIARDHGGQFSQQD